MRKFLSAVLCVVMVLSLLPGAAFAAGTDETFVPETHDVFKHTESTLAPGVEQYINYAYAKDGKQMVYYVATADISRDDVVVQTSYKEQYTNKKFGMQRLTDQIAYANDLYTDKSSERYISEYYSVVAGVNASFYNMTTGQPSGITYLDGVQIGESASYAQFFAITRDGKAVVDYTKNLSQYDGNIYQAVAGSVMLVWDGKDVTASASGSYNTDRHSRTCVGVTADGKVVMMVLDGRQEPFSCGGTMHELAQIMLEAGCVAAINLDGGGSTTYAARPEGSDSVKVINRPSDGSERSISSGLIIASTAVPSDAFDHVSMVATDEYVTPGTSTKVTIAGVSSVGSAAEIPEDLSFSVVNGSFEDGFLTADGEGDVVLTAKYNGAEVGSVTIHSVIPTAISFSAEKRTVSYGKTIDFTVSATVNDGLYPVKYKDGDIVLTMDNELLGTIDGLSYTAADSSSGLTGGVITATLVFDSSVTDTVTISLTGLPDEPVIYEDFEDQPDYRFEYSQWYYATRGEYEIVDSTTGKVHSGDHALAVTVELRGSSLNGYHGGMHIGAKTDIYSNTGKYDKISGTKTFEDLDLTNAKSLGMWIYIPEDSQIFYVQFRLRGKDNYSSQLQYRLYDYGYSTTERGHTGWQYFEVDFDEVNTADVEYNDGSFYLERIDIYACTRNDEANQTNYGYNRDNQQSVQGPITFYFDDITVEYVDTGMDNVDPTFDYIRATYGGMSDSVALNGQTITSNVVSVTARASDAGVGIDPASAKAYIDGVEVTSGFRCDELGIMTIDDVTLADGTHTFTFVISDKNGNCEYVTRQLTVDADSDIPTASLKLAEELTDRPLFGQVLWMNLEVDNSENVDTISTHLNLNSESIWELEHMVVAYGFEASYTIDSVTNNATITITQTGKTELSGHDVVVQIPVRMYYADPLVDSTNDPLSSSTLPPEDIKLSMDKGLVSYQDGTSSSFSMKKLDIDSEVYAWYDVRNTNGDIVSGYLAHIHTAEAVEDQAATCTKDGYTGRTYCEVCNSVVDWGTTVPATGHSYTLVDGVMTCHCGRLLTGELDGKHYTDGILMQGWYGDSYYAEGVLLTGVQEVDGFYYNFGEDGECAGREKYTGMFVRDGSTYFAKLGVLTSGWQSIEAEDGESYFYYFDPADYTMYTGVRVITDRDNRAMTYTFNEAGQLVRGAFYKTSAGTKYYIAGESQFRRFVTLEEGTYWLDINGYVAYGNAHTVTTNVHDITWYHFDEDTGLMTGLCSGIFQYRGEPYWCDENGKLFYGLIQTEDGIVFSATLGKLYRNQSCYVDSSTNTLGCQLESGTYWCDENGYLVSDGFVTISGSTYYFTDYVRAKGFVKIGEDYYLFHSGNGTMRKDGNYWVGENEYGIEPGTHYFGADGKMFIPDLENGTKAIVEENGKLYFTIDGVRMTNGLYELDGDYYYAQSNGVLATSRSVYLETELFSGNGWYGFGSDAKLILTGFVSGGKSGEIYTYYYENGVRARGLMKIGEDYYLFNSGSGAMRKDGNFWVGENEYGIVPGTYHFGADGKMFLPDLENGTKAIVEEDGKLYFTIDGVRMTNGLYELDGAYYFATYSGQLATDTVVYVETELLSGNGWYGFGSDARLIMTGFVTNASGNTYYYADGVRARGLMQIGEDYYLFHAYNGVMRRDGNFWVNANDYGIVPGMYHFYADGKMFLPDLENGTKAIVEEDGKLYFTIDGVRMTNGLYELDGAYYFATYSGQLATDTVVYVETELLSGNGWYGFGSDAKLIMTGFVTNASGNTYYYADGVRATGLVKIGEDYYLFHSYNGVMRRDNNFWVGENDYGIVPGMYHFDAEGRMELPQAASRVLLPVSKCKLTPVIGGLRKTVR